MKYLSLIAFTLLVQSVQSQTYSKVVSDSDIVSFINSDILNDSIKLKKTIRRQIFKLHPDHFYYKDSADFARKNANPNFIFQYHTFNGRVQSNHLDSLFSRKDIDFFYTQIKAQKARQNWQEPFFNSELVDEVELDSNRYAKQVMYSYSLPLFSFDRKRAIIIKAFFCGFLCGGGAYYIYEKDSQDNWQLIRKINEWGE